MQDDYDASRIDKLVGARLRDLRAARGYSQSVLGEAIGVSFQQVQKYENGANRISASALIRVVQTLGVTVSVFFEGIEPGSGDGHIDHGSVDLMRDFNRIRSPEVRARLGALVKQLADD